MGKSGAISERGSEAKKANGKHGAATSGFQHEREACLQLCDYVHPSVFFHEAVHSDSRKCTFKEFLIVSELPAYNLLFCADDLAKTVRNLLPTSGVFAVLQRNGMNKDNEDDELDLDENAKKHTVKLAVDTTTANGSESIGHLKEKLHAKIQELRASRTHQIEEHNRHVKEAGTKKQKGDVKQRKVAVKGEKKVKKPEDKKIETTKTTSASNATRGADQLSGLLTSRIETLEDAALLEKQHRRMKKRIERYKLVGKDYSKLLKRISKHDATLKRLAESNPKRAERVAERRLLTTAIDRAAGLKIRDNPDLIRKSMKAKDGRKRRSKQEWQTRKEDVTQRKDERQRKRRENIDKRKDAKQKHKVDRARKRGRFVIKQSKAK